LVHVGVEVPDGVVFTYVKLGFHLPNLRLDSLASLSRYLHVSDEDLAMSASRHPLSR
jgi:hypothetical protein